MILILTLSLFSQFLLPLISVPLQDPEATVQGVLHYVDSVWEWQHPLYGEELDDFLLAACSVGSLA